VGLNIAPVGKMARLVRSGAGRLVSRIGIVTPQRSRARLTSPAEQIIADGASRRMRSDWRSSRIRMNAIPRGLKAVKLADLLVAVVKGSRRHIGVARDRSCAVPWCLLSMRIAITKARHAVRYASARV